MNNPDNAVYYRHHKGNYYQFLFCAKHTETLEELVIYRALYGEGKVWARPYDMFFSMVDKADGPVRRFQPVSLDEVRQHVPEGMLD